MPFDLNEANPLLDFKGLARFSEIRPEHVSPAIDTLLGQCRTALARICEADAPASWDTVVAPLDEVTERLARAWGNVSHLNAVVDTPALRAQYNANLPKLTAFWTELAQNPALCERYRQLAALPGFATWPRGRRAVVEHELRDFRLGGAELPAPLKDRLRQVRERLSQLSTKFAENVLDTTNAFTLQLDDAGRLAGVPDDIVATYRDAAAEAGHDGYRITLHFPSYYPILQYAQDRSLREQLYRAYATRASELGRPEWDNTENMLELLRLRAEQASLLGYADYAALSLVPKMAKSPAQVIDFLRDLARRARAQAVREMEELRAFAAAELALPQLQAWDIAFASEKLRQARYAYSAQEVKQYFPVDKVLAGLFGLIERLFGVRIRPDTATSWHPDVSFHRVEAADGSLVGQFYLDLYARDHKQGGAWQDDARLRYRGPQTLQTPVSFLTCNFSRPVRTANGRTALLTHDEVITLFHEFGHGLHHLLTQVDELSVSGIRGVEWDAVELPSQFMENYCWQWEVLREMSGHVSTGEPLPRELYDRMLAAKHFQSGMHLVRQLEFALFDMRLHTEIDAWKADRGTLLQLAEDVRREVAVVIPPSFFRGAWSFSHIFAGGYSAGYYSYLWAEVLSADAFAAFEEAGDVFDAALGARLRNEVLAVGGSRPALESFVAFRGREPRIDALLRHNGID